MARTWRNTLLATAAAFMATELRAQTTSLPLSYQYYQYFQNQSNYRQAQKTQAEQQKQINFLRNPPLLSAPRNPVGPAAADDADTELRSPQLTARPLPAIYGGPGATRQYFQQRRSYFNPR